MKRAYERPLLAFPLVEPEEAVSSRSNTMGKLMGLLRMCLGTLLDDVSAGAMAREFSDNAVVDRCFGKKTMWRRCE
jgi:hypothetical protein